MRFNRSIQVLTTSAAFLAMALPAAAATNTNPNLIDPSTGFTATGTGSTTPHMAAKKHVTHKVVKKVVAHKVKAKKHATAATTTPSTLQ